VTEFIAEKSEISSQFCFRGSQYDYSPTTEQVSTCSDLHLYSLQRLSITISEKLP
jgi:hypothetical protein